MNLQDTQTFLTMLWSLFPNAPKCDADSKKAMVSAWFYVLHEYTINDVWTAAQSALRDKPSFIPTAYEVLARCKKTLNPDLFLGSEYEDLESKFTGSTNLYQSHNNYDYELRCLCRELGDEHEKERIDEINGYIRHNIEQRNIDSRLSELLNAASEAAERAYDKAEQSRYYKDIQSLGWTLQSAIK